MSDRAQVLAAKIDGTSPTERAARVLAWLVEIGIVEPLPTDSGLAQLAHRPGPKVLDAVLSPPTPDFVDFRSLRTNGMELRQTFRAELQASGDEMPSFACPTCSVPFVSDAVFPLLEDLGSPFRPPPEIACAACSTHSALSDLTVDGGAFANLVLRFWNWWPLNPSFVAKVEEQFGAPVVLLYERL